MINTPAEEERIKNDRINRIGKSKIRTIDKIMDQFFYDKYTEEPTLIEEEFMGLKDEFLKWSYERSAKSRYKYAMFTINFIEGVELVEILKRMKKCCSKKWIERYMWCIEQRGTGDIDLGEGKHVHLKVWIKDGKSVYRCRGEVYNTFKKMVGNKKHVNVRYSNRKGCFGDYIRGYKGGKKKDKYDADQAFRERNNLMDVYYS